MSFGKKFLICPILPPMSDLTPFYGTLSQLSNLCYQKSCCNFFFTNNFAIPMFSDDKATYCNALFGEDTVEMYVHCAFIVQYSMHMYTLFSIGSGHGSGLNHSKFTTLLYAVVYTRLWIEKTNVVVDIETEISGFRESLGAIEIANAVRKKSLDEIETAIRVFETQPRRDRDLDR